MAGNTEIVKAPGRTASDFPSRISSQMSGIGLAASSFVGSVSADPVFSYGLSVIAPLSGSIAAHSRTTLLPISSAFSQVTTPSGSYSSVSSVMPVAVLESPLVGGASSRPPLAPSKDKASASLLVPHKPLHSSAASGQSGQPKDPAGCTASVSSRASSSYAVGGSTSASASTTHSSVGSVPSTSSGVSSPRVRPVLVRSLS